MPEKLNKCLEEIVLVLLLAIYVVAMLVLMLTNVHAKTIVHQPKYYACYSGEKYAVYVPGKLSLPVIERNKVVKCTGEGRI